MGLKEYQHKRDFKSTTEPSGKRSARAKSQVASFVIQKHAASHLHYDLRLEMDGVLKSWAVPKGPSLDSTQKRLAVQVEDHPLDYGHFEGSIPKGEYGGGDVIVWDNGNWIPKGNPRQGLKIGRLEFTLEGHKLHGKWVLVRMRRTEGKPQWLLIKHSDEAAISESKYQVTVAEPESVITGETLPGEKRAKKSVAKSVAKPRKKKSSQRLPAFIKPQLARLSESPPVGPQWIHEVKFDGYRTLCRVQGKKIRFFTRNGLDWTSKYGGDSKGLTAEVRKLPVRSAWIDGEICVSDTEGVTQFHLLQNALQAGKFAGLVYYVFDLLELDGEDLRGLPLEARKARLAALLATPGGKKSNLVFSDHLEGEAKKLLAEGCRRGMEGILSKDRMAEYQSGRSSVWLKSKCGHHEEFLIAGYMPSHARAGFRSLVMASRNEDGKLIYVGRVGTGFDAKDLRDLSGRFEKIRTEKSPFDAGEESRVEGKRSVVWLQPKFIAQVAFRAWTGDHVLRQASYQGLRLDKPAKEIKLEEAMEVTKEKGKRGREVTLTHPDKVLIPDVKLTKQQIADYYMAIQERILPHVKDRPLSLLRCPDGITKECFFQKNLNLYKPPQLVEEDMTSPKGSKATLIYLENVEGLIALTQMNVLEIHMWGTHRDHPLKPDLMVFDLDPGPGVTPKAVVEAAYSVRDVLKYLGLESFVKASGGKGFHIHVPIEPRYSWDDVKNFAKTIAQHFEALDSKHYIASATKVRRQGRIFIDYLRNGYGATSVAPYSLRARKGGPVALPIEWEEVAKTAPDAFDISAALKRLKKKDPWERYGKVRQRIALLENRRGRSSLKESNPLS